MPQLRPIPVPHAPDDGTTASRAWSEALATTREDTDAAHRSRGELVAAALSAHRILSRDFGRSVPVTALGPDGAPRGLAAFVAVYAAQRERERKDQQERQEQERPARRDRGDRARRDDRGLGEAA
ncbi:hypothetical protein ACPCSQ_17990 [Streptomyces griseoincarnatus]|uniref:hypothetical protein n=1 Tax=Streptomyces sp. SMS_SU21 TaxID=2069440 RepID=UPI000C87E6FB|nr:hypothetical protein [Streptomyces sp. SMS_SU21]MCA2205348.1 hypothetical protein [Streptomyces sp. SMS_SU21]NEA97415.1 hypothetical protein [Actinospica acidiphila]